MAFDLVRWLLPLLVVASLSTTTEGQEVIPPARTILDLGESEQIAFINKTIELGFPENRADQMTMLIINRSAIALPLIEARLEKALKSTSPPKGFVDTASEMIAYAGDEQALRAIAKLVHVDEDRFGPLVGRTLDNAGNWRNPFTVAYKGVELGDEGVAHRVTAWVETALASNRMQRAWAEAMLERYGIVPDESVWATDAIASRLTNQTSPELRQSVQRFVAEAQTKRGKR
jgi:hypothetical protein